MPNPDIKEQILEFLKAEYPKDFNIQEIADKTNIHRNSVSTYLKVLVAEGRIEITRKMGKMQLFSYIKKE